MSFEYLIFSKSLPNNLKIKLIGVKTVKKTKPMTIGAIILPNNSPSFIQAFLNGSKIIELINPKIKNITEIIKDQALISFDFKIGQSPIIKNTIKNKIPKLLLEVFFFFHLN